MNFHENLWYRVTDDNTYSTVRLRLIIKSCVKLNVRFFLFYLSGKVIDSQNLLNSTRSVPLAAAYIEKFIILKSYFRVNIQKAQPLVNV